ncbi:hypothetical protein BGZ47_002891 [Haplosporangium gracile]|nr:hypothetical protein BGZ47_002891 [Haplosporangium gracile]
MALPRRITSLDNLRNMSLPWPEGISWEEFLSGLETYPGLQILTMHRLPVFAGVSEVDIGTISLDLRSISYSGTRRSDGAVMLPLKVETPPEYQLEALDYHLSLFSTWMIFLQEERSYETSALIKTTSPITRVALRLVLGECSVLDDLAIWHSTMDLADDFSGTSSPYYRKRPSLTRLHQSPHPLRSTVTYKTRPLDQGQSFVMTINSPIQSSLSPEGGDINNTMFPENISKSANRTDPPKK